MERKEEIKNEINEKNIKKKQLRGEGDSLKKNSNQYGGKRDSSEERKRLLRGVGRRERESLVKRQTA